MLTEKHLLTPEWLAALVSGQCIFVRGHVPGRVLDCLKTLLPRGVLSPQSVDVPAVGDLGAEFLGTIMPASIGEVPRRVYFLPSVLEENAIALTSLKASKAWLQWVAVVPDPSFQKPIMPGVLLFDAKVAAFLDGAAIPPVALAWARDIMGDAADGDEISRRVSAEGPKILGAVHAVAQGDYESLPVELGQADGAYLEALFSFARDLVGAQGVVPAEVAKNVHDSARKSRGNSGASVTRPQIFSGGKAVALRASGDPVVLHIAEVDAIRRDPEMYAAFMSILRDIRCTDCELSCHAPEQKWSCLREGQWQQGVPAAIADRWLEVFAGLVGKTGRGAREALQVFEGILAKIPGSRVALSQEDFARLAGEGKAPQFATSVAPPVQPDPSDKPMKTWAPQTSHATGVAAQPSLEAGAPRKDRFLARITDLSQRLDRIVAAVSGRSAKALPLESLPIEERLNRLAEDSDF
ncbi:MAG TPA: hypothetical protein VKK79_05930 [Candidatus Lokiarchaeia archaeon]|nr:hypothetical protein [Candidatus Lokiarchaeia archaeon]